MYAAKRKEDFDYMKGVLILFVIWGHFCMYLSGSDYEKNLLTTYIRLFQMPLFIFISGYFQKPITSSRQAVQKIIKSVKHIGLPMASWIILVYVVKCGININHFNGLLYFIDQARGIVSLFWYLGCLLICLCLYALLALCYNYNKHLGVFLFIVSNILVVLLKTLSIFYFSFLWQFFCLGLLYKNYEEEICLQLSKLKHFEKLLICIALIISVICLGGGTRPHGHFIM